MTKRDELNQQRENMREASGIIANLLENYAKDNDDAQSIAIDAIISEEAYKYEWMAKTGQDCQ